MFDLPKLKFRIYSFFNGLFHRAFFIYRPLYFIYKRISDRQAIAQIRKIIKPGMTVLDIGANIGFYSLLFSRLAGDTGKVHAFEPDGQNFAYLQQNAGKCRNIILNNAAVGERSGEITLFLSDVFNVDHQTYDSGENRRKASVKCVSIDDYLAGGQKADFVKIDIQGYDHFAVKGMMRTLARAEAVVMFGEFWPYGLKKAGVEPRAYLQLLEGLGFAVTLENGASPRAVLAEADNKFFYSSFFAVKGMRLP